MASPSPDPRSRTPSHGDPSLASISESQDQTQLPRRRSFSFLRRSKSGDRIATTRKVSNGKLNKKQRLLSREQEMEREQIPGQPPRIPDLPRPPQLQTFGGEDARPDSVAIVSNKLGSYRQGGPRDSMDTETSPGYPNVPIPPIPRSSPGPNVDPYARTESMTNRGRYSYASSMVSAINSPRRVRRRKDPTPFNVLVIGARNSGKTSFIEFLRKSLDPPSRKQRPHHPEDGFDVRNTSVSKGSFPNFTSHYLETEIENERIGLTLWDSQGLESNIVDLQLREMSSFLESKFEDTFAEENKVVRAPGVRDTHIHCVFLVLDPSHLDANIATAKKSSTTKAALRNGNSFLESGTTPLIGGLDENLDLQVLRTLRGKTTVVPVIAKADTITSAHMAHLKRLVWESLKKENLNTLEALGLDDSEADSIPDVNQLNEADEDLAIAPQERPRKERKFSDADLSVTSHLDSASSISTSQFSAADFDLAKPTKPVETRSRTPPSPGPLPTETPYLPLSIISPDLYEPDIVGRKFPWGFADPHNAEHCDFLRLKEMVFTEWRGELREASRELWYEGWRTSRLNGRAVRAGRGVGEQTMKRWRGS